MKKILLFLFFVSMAFVVNAQVLRPSGLPTTNSPSRYDVTGYQRDSAFLYILRDSFPAKYPSVIYHPNGNLYKTEGGVGAYWTLITDTTWLSNRIDLKLSIADTAAMLSNYLHKTDTAGMLQPYAKYSDTSNMLTPYHQSFYTATFDTTTRILTMYPIAGTVPTILSIPRGGSISGISSLTPYRVPGSDVQYLIADNGDAPGFTLKTADSATIMHFSDTATMLAPYAHSQAVVKYYDTSAMLSKYVRYTDTANIVANRLKISDTATMLANRLKISDTATMLGGYKTYYPRTAISGGSGITYDPTTGVISNSSPSSGGTVTIVSAGVGMNFTTITTTGSVNADTLVLATRLHVDSVAMRKLNLTDTSTMLSSRLKISDTATMLRNHATYAETLSGKNISGSTNNLSNIGNSSLINSTISGIPLGSNLSALTNGFGITTLSYNGSTAKVVIVDTSSSGVATWALLKKKIDSVSAIGGGSVSSVGLVLPSFITVSGSPITTSGTLTGTLANQTANTVFSGPTTGSASQPAFRALVAADLTASTLQTVTTNGNNTTNEITVGGLISTNSNSFVYNSAIIGTFNFLNTLSNVSSGTGHNSFIKFSNGANALNSFGMVENAGANGDFVFNSFHSGSYIEPFRISSGGNITGLGTLTVAGLSSGSAGNFVVNGGGGLLVTRTASQVLSDIGAGTVSSISTTNGILGGTITTTGTLQVDSSLYSTKAYVLKIASDTSTSLRTLINTKGTGNGTVTSVAAGTGMSFTTITTSGTVNADTSVLSTKANVFALLLGKLSLSDTATMLSNYARKYASLTNRRVIFGNLNGELKDTTGFTFTGSGDLNVPTSINTESGNFSSTINIGVTSNNGVLNLNNTSATQAAFYGYSDFGVNRPGSGKINLGSNGLFQGTIQYYDGGSTVLYVDNTFDNVSAAINFRLRTNGTPVIALALDGAGNGVFSNTVKAVRVIGNSAADNGIDAIQSGGGSILGNIYRVQGKIQATSTTIDATATLWNDNTNGSTVTYTLPSTASLSGGFFMFIKTGTGTLTLTAYAANKIIDKTGTPLSNVSLTSTNGLNRYYFDGDKWYQVN